MTLNSPETAPKDAIILADFGRPYQHLVPAVWNPAQYAWVAAHKVYGAYSADTNYTSFGGKHVEAPLRGWMPLPSIPA